jgi:hypothetical protein
VFLNDKNSSILAQDTLALLRQLNQGQRRAVKVSMIVIVIGNGWT